MPLQNRVDPEGRIVATPARGTMFGNRGGCFHRPDRTLLRRRFASKQWICCVLSFKDRRRSLMSPGLYTELFFLDEATAFAAGHRPCFECRRADAVRYAELWNAIDGRPGRASAPEMDDFLHRQRISKHGDKLCVEMRFGDVAPGAMVRAGGRPMLVGDGGVVRPWSFEGYGAPIGLAASASVDVVTPQQTHTILKMGYRVGVHPSAKDR